MNPFNPGLGRRRESKELVRRSQFCINGGCSVASTGGNLEIPPLMLSST